MGRWAQSGGTGLSRVLLTFYLAGLALVAFWPTPIDRPIAGKLRIALFALHAAGLPKLINYDFVEFSFNVLMFVPIGILAALAFPAVHRSWIVLAAFLASCGMEAGQLLFLIDRFPSAMDIVANTGGGMLGVGVLGMVENWFRRADFDRLNQRDWP